VIFRDLAPEESAWVPVGAAWKPNGLSAPVVSQFVDVLAQACANGNGESQAPCDRPFELRIQAAVTVEPARDLFKTGKGQL
jgi:hypothetical protein